jgi:alpha-beta hydrolase superfamily lysophospholipase
LILNVEHIKQFAPRLGRQVVLREIPGGKHDLTLSRQEPRELCLRVIGDWLSRFP